MRICSNLKFLVAWQILDGSAGVKPLCVLENIMKIIDNTPGISS